MHKVPTTASIRRLFDYVLISDDDLEAYALDYFPHIKRLFSNGMNRTAKVNLLLERADLEVLIGCLRESDPDSFNRYKGEIQYKNEDPLRQLDDAELKYYVYISHTKIQMLIQQVTGIDLSGNIYRLLNATLERLNMLMLVGSIEKPRKYISGKLLMKYGVLTDYAADLAFFGGTENNTTVALIGSSASILGQNIASTTSHSLHYYILKFLNKVVKSGKIDGPELEGSSYQEATKVAMESPLPGHAHLDFVAKVLFREPGLIVATPLYVALSD